jgi:hypothetical protein
MKDKRIDYTKMRKGRVVRQWTYRDKDGTTKVGESRIIVCPKCGRKGEGAPVDPTMVTHAAELVNGYMTYLLIVDACHLPKQPQVQS